MSGEERILVACNGSDEAVLLTVPMEKNRPSFYLSTYKRHSWNAAVYRCDDPRWTEGMVSLWMRSRLRNLTW